MHRLQSLLAALFMLALETTAAHADPAAWSYESNNNGALLGYTLSPAGDVNGDGFQDVIAGAPVFSNGQASEGRAMVFLGTGTTLQASPSWTAESNQASALYGISVSAAGDVNGDGYGDVVVGASPWDGAAGPDAGRVDVYYGSPSGLSPTPSWSLEGSQVGCEFGRSVACAGDVNGDGYSDVIIGADRYDNTIVDQGRAYLFLGSASGLSTTPAWIGESDGSGSLYGASVAGAGDLNADGYADVIVGAPWY